MAKASKVKKPKERGKYEEKLVVKGSFLDIMQAAVKNAKDNVGKKKKP